ncbi:hypothetical protein CgunFtcFv8_015130 [Champsocephalus gunnari]|uniref:Uncharacterized protein n=1 Tax=Champsocephalus gunnari TaxID=52237 RepID=A0AAN8ID03_CHAGU|nr:hypothetical protein CgunFtcFv8_015130 [Champsocephalus gunnari]
METADGERQTEVNGGCSDGFDSKMDQCVSDIQRLNPSRPSVKISWMTGARSLCPPHMQIIDSSEDPMDVQLCDHSLLL